jgi:hypothetical protein
VNCKCRFGDLPQQRLAGVQKRIADELLSNCAAAFNNSPRAHVVNGCAKNASHVDAKVGVESTIFKRKQVWGNLLYRLSIAFERKWTSRESNKSGVVASYRERWFCVQAP